MKKTLLSGVFAAAWIAVLLMRVYAAPVPQNRAAGRTSMVDFGREVRPIIEANCLECHSQDKRKGGLSLATYPDILDGGKDGPVVRPGNGAGSLMFHRITAQVEPQMPLDELPLSDEEIALVRLWIDQGARPEPTAPPAPPPWEAPLALARPAVPAAAWPAWSQPLDRFVSSYLAKQRTPEPALVSDTVFARRAYLDIWGLLPPPAALQSFVSDRTPDKRSRLVATLLEDNSKYAEHWISFWNDLLRNEDGVTYFSENNGRRSISEWLLASLTSNRPYDDFVTKLINPAAPGDPEGFLIGVNWRGETSAAVMPWMQASQNTAQVFLGVNMKCNACHDSFVSRWKLKDAYALAAYFSPDPKLQLFRCDVARDQYAEPGFLYPELSRVPASTALADRRAAAAAIFTDPRNGRMPRTIVNRVWDRLLGHGIVTNSDEMDGKPWSPELLDWVASDFVEHRYDIKHLIATIMSSRAYQMPSVTRAGEPPARNYVFAGPEVRRLTAEQFADAVGTITGEWSIYYPAVPRPPGQRPPTASDPVSAGLYGREWRAASSKLTRALGRPIRDQVTSARATEATTLQGLELVNGEILTRWLMRGARRMLGQLSAEPASLYNAAVGGRYAAARPYDIDVSKASKLWLIVTDTGSNAPERVQPVWTQPEFVRADGTTVPLSSLTPVDGSGLRTGGAANDAASARIPVKNPSSLVYDVAGKNFVRFKGSADIENARSEVGSTLNPALRFFVFDAEPNLERLIPPEPELPFQPPAVPGAASEVVDRIFWQALNRAPSAAERRDALAAISDARSGRPSVDGVADLLWAVLMKPEFQLIY
jgi:mono/diheme cytochrome c family protein